MNTRRITKADFDRIVEVIDQWWGGPISTFAHPIFFYELGASALIVENTAPGGGASGDPGAGPSTGEMIGFLLGFVAHEPVRTGYVHLVGIHPEFRRQGVGRLLYEDFVEACRANGCVRMKAITTTGNEGSIRFHLGVGWTATEVEDYAGMARKRVVFTKELGDA